MLKNFKNSGIGFADDKDELVEASKGDSMKSDIEMAANIVATSTPQKAAVVCSGNIMHHQSDKQIIKESLSWQQKITRVYNITEETLTAFNDSTFIGQGDEEIERVNTYLLWSQFVLVIQALINLCSKFHQN